MPQSGPSSSLQQTDGSIGARSDMLLSHQLSPYDGSSKSLLLPQPLQGHCFASSDVSTTDTTFDRLQCVAHLFLPDSATNWKLICG